MKPAPGMEMEHKTDISEQGVLKAVVVHSLLPPIPEQKGMTSKARKVVRCKTKTFTPPVIPS